MIDSTLKKITPVNTHYKTLAKEHWDTRTHPVGSLGILEDITIQLAGIQEKTIPTLEKKTIIVMCADNGVVAEGTSSSPQIYTQMLANAMARGETGVATLAKRENAKLIIVDIGMCQDIPIEAGIVKRPIRLSTGNIARENAITRKEAIEAINIGVDMAENEIKKGASIIGTGELGIGNTTTASALLYAITRENITDCVGYGAGITKAAWEKKVRVVESAVNRIKDEDDIIDILAKVGGLDIAGLVGVFLASAANKTAVVVDGLITGVAALIAIKLKKEVADYIFLSHKSAEKAFVVLADALNKTPPLHLAMRLGEGSGCPLFFQLLESALYAMTHMASMKDNDIDPSVLVNLRSH